MCSAHLRKAAAVLHKSQVCGWRPATHTVRGTMSRSMQYDPFPSSKFVCRTTRGEGQFAQAPLFLYGPQFLQAQCVHSYRQPHALGVVA